MTHVEKYADWQARHGIKAAALEKAIARQLGMRAGIKTDLGQQTVDLMAIAVLSALLGWGDAPEPESPADPPPLAAAKKALDLEEVETPLTGRDRAAGRDD